MHHPIIRGAVDRLESERVVGWLYGTEYAEPPRVLAFLHQESVGEALAEIHRPDLEAVGFGDGRCGFEIRFSRRIDPAYFPFITIRPDNVDLHLPIASSANYMDLINAVSTDFPGAGRNRSLLGGLWTDRSDAGRLLSGRIAAGACAAEMQLPLKELIVNGHVVLFNALGPKGMTAKDRANIEFATGPHRGLAQGEDEPEGPDLKSALGGIATFLFRDPVVRLLRAVFDDQPMIYRLDRVADDASEFTQACSFETLPSPTECLLLYVGHPDGQTRIEFISDSHEMPEFGLGGRSRWTPDGAADLKDLAARSGLSVETLEIDALDVAVIGPGLVHRVSASADAPGLRAFAAPRRIAPERFFVGETAWTEVEHVSGARIRL